MKGIKFTYGTLELLAETYYTLTLYNSCGKVYAATINQFDAADLFLKHKNIKYIN